MGIRDLIDQNSIEHLFHLFALATSLVFFWFLEAVYRLNKRWLIPVIIFPCSIFIFVINYWEDNRGRVFYAAMLVILMLVIGGLVGESFFDRIFGFLATVAFWPYYAYNYITQSF